MLLYGTVKKTVIMILRCEKCKIIDGFTHLGDLWLWSRRSCKDRKGEESE